jgi:hypothetical protein
MRQAAASLVVAAALAVAGCGSSSRPAASSPAATAGSLRADTAVVRGWSDALRAGQLDRAAAYFALPSTVQLMPGGPLAAIRSRADARAFDELLPCGARLIGARRVGRFVDALFVLSPRPGVRCDGTGATARTAFDIAGGKISQWRRVPDEPGDGRFAKPSPSQPSPSPRTPSPSPSPRAPPPSPRAPTQSI